MDNLVTMRAKASIVPATMDYDKLVELAKSKAPDPSVFDQYEAVFWRAQVSNNRLDFYSTAMAETSLKNYVEDLQNGISFQDSHDWRKNGWGQSIDGELVKLNETVDIVDMPLRQVYGTFFTLAGVQMGDQKSDDFIANIRSGLWKDVSIGFYARDITCSICGKQSFEWWKEDGCTHLPGVEYEDEDSKSRKKVLAWGSVNDGRLMETSQVYDGATPDAEISQVVVKARALASERMITEREIAQVESRYQVRVARPAPLVQLDRTMVPVGGRDMGEKDKNQKPADVQGREANDDGKNVVPNDAPVVDDTSPIDPPVVEQPVDTDAIADETVIELPGDESEPVVEGDEGGEGDPAGERAAKPVDVLASVRAHFEGTGIKVGRDAAQAVRSLGDTVLELHRRNADLAKDAELGRRYRKDMIDSAISEGVRAQGDKFNEPRWRGMLEKMDIDDIIEVTETFEREARANLPKTPSVNESDQSPLHAGDNGEIRKPRRKRNAYRG